MTDKIEKLRAAIQHIDRHGLISGNHKNFELMHEGEFDDIFQTITTTLMEAFTIAKSERKTP